MICLLRTIEMDPLCENGYYLKSSALSSLHKYQEAYEEVQTLMASVDPPSEHAYKLKGFLCTKIKPPNYREAVDTFDVYLKLHPEDMNAVSKRAKLQFPFLI
jgi:tetratricopeptide (TPR) repeat protein